MKINIFKVLFFIIIFCFALHPSYIYADERIKMNNEDGLYTMPCLVNGLPMKFFFDTGASMVSISITVAEFMYNNGWINENDFRGPALTQIANGDIEENMKLNLREIKIGNRVIYNVEAVVSNSYNAPLLLGQSVIRQLEPWSIENGYLILKDKYDPEAARKLQEQAARQGDAKAQFSLGCRYYDNHDYQQAVYWYRKAAEQGNAAAQNNLGYCFENGLGVYPNYQQALYWYRKSAEQKNNIAQNNLRVLYKKIDRNTLYYFGESYYNGKGVAKNYQEAVYCYKLAAERGHIKAQYNLGECYYKGTGVDQSYEMAANCWKKAAYQGDAKSQYNLGECYYNGDGVEQSYIKAIKYYIQAAMQGHSKAINTLIKFFLLSFAIIIIAIFIFRKW